MRSKQFSFQHTFEVELSDGVFQEFTYTIYATYVPAERGHRDSLGAPEEPDYPSYAQIEEIYNEQGQLMPEGSFEESQLDELVDAATLFYEEGQGREVEYEFDEEPGGGNYWP